MHLFSVNADVPSQLVTMHSVFCKEGQPRDKRQSDGGWKEFESRSAALNWLISWSATNHLKLQFCQSCDPMD